MRFTFQQIISHSLGLGKHNQGLRETDMGLSPKRGSNKINMLKKGRKTSEEEK